MQRRAVEPKLNVRMDRAHRQLTTTAKHWAAATSLPTLRIFTRFCKNCNAWSRWTSKRKNRSCDRRILVDSHPRIERARTDL